MAVNTVARIKFTVTSVDRNVAILERYSFEPPIGRALVVSMNSPLIAVQVQVVVIIDL